MNEILVFTGVLGVVGCLFALMLEILHGIKPQKWVKPKIKHGRTTKWGWRVHHPEKLKMGENVDIGFGCFIQAEAGVLIEKDVKIGGGVKVYSVNTIDDTRGAVIIGKGATIGANSVILPGAFIKEGQYVKALSIVKGV